MTAATTTTPTKLAALCDALRGQVVAGVRIHDARAELVPGATGETIIRLDDPAAGADTWPLDALRDMETRAWDEAATLAIPEWVYVKHAPPPHQPVTARSRAKPSCPSRTASLASTTPPVSPAVAPSLRPTTHSSTASLPTQSAAHRRQPGRP